MKKSKETNYILCQLLAELNNIIFSTKYFQFLTWQTNTVKARITITLEQFNNVIAGLSSNMMVEKETLYIARDNKGNLKGTFYLPKKGKAIYNFTDKKQEEIIKNNIIERIEKFHLLQCDD